MKFQYGLCPLSSTLDWLGRVESGLSQGLVCPRADPWLLLNAPEMTSTGGDYDDEGPEVAP